MAPHGSVIDISQPNTGVNALIIQQIQEWFVEPKRRNETPYLPDELLYQGNGQNIWSTLVLHPDYYQFRDEGELLEKNGEQLAEYMPSGCTLIDLGAGFVDSIPALFNPSSSSPLTLTRVTSNTQKTENLLTVFERRKQPTLYLALDISRPSLQENMAFLSTKHSHVYCIGLHGTFADALDWCTRIPSPRVFLSFGSVLFNDNPEIALRMLRDWSAIMRPKDLILAGMDGSRVPHDSDMIKRSYNHDSDLYLQYWQHGFSRANALIGEECFRLEDWITRSVLTADPVRHFFAFRARRDVVMGKLGVMFREGEEMEWFDGHKYPEGEIRDMCSRAGLQVVEAWKAGGSEMSMTVPVSCGERMINCSLQGSI